MFTTSLLPQGHYYGVILAKGDKQKEQTEHKLHLPNLFKEQVDLAYQGFELALRLIEERVPRPGE